jgi:hypothetical protein
MKRLVTCMLVIATAAQADSLEEKQFWKHQRNWIDEQLKTAEKACGFKIEFDWDGPATLRAETAKTKHSPNGVCGAIVDEVAAICREGADEKAAVKSKISAITCGYAKPRTLQLDGKTLRYHGNNVEPNFSAWAKPWLLKSL